MTKRNGWKMSCAGFALCAVMAISAHAQTLTSLFAFHGPDGKLPNPTLVQGVDGGLYGTTRNGAASCPEDPEEGCGTGFRFSPSGTAPAVLRFVGSNGAYPAAGLALGPGGILYGTTAGGGAYGFGEIFRANRAGLLTTVYSFCAQGYPLCPDGSYPQFPLVEGVDGGFYGTTPSGGTGSQCPFPQGCGTLFRITPAGAFVTLYNFCAQASCADGSVPYGSLVQGLDGNLYGVTFLGGTPFQNYGGGTLFRISLAGSLSIVYNFCSQTLCVDGGSPAWLIQASDGNFYGVASGGGAYGFGTVFKLTPAGVLTALYSFCAESYPCTDGAYPNGLTQGTDGNLYGSTSGGIEFEGTIFEITTGGTLTTVHSFDGIDGNGAGTLLQATDGKFYGTTFFGGDFKCFTPGGSGIGCGTIFRLDMGFSPFVTFVQPFGTVGQTGAVLGQGFSGTTAVSVNGVSANFKVVSDTYLTATIPPGATTGYVTVTTPSGTLTSNVLFHVLP